MIAPENSSQTQNNSADPTNFMAEAPIGTLVYGIASDGMDAPQVEILIRETDEEIARQAEPPELAMRAGIVTTTKLPVPVVLFRFVADGPIYASFWNYYHLRAPDEPNALECMDAEPHELIFKLFDDSGRVSRLFACRHPLGNFFRSACHQASKLPPWGEEVFREALDDIYNQFPDIQSLWNAFLAA